jgi:hypothetical protein
MAAYGALFQTSGAHVEMRIFLFRSNADDAAIPLGQEHVTVRTFKQGKACHPLGPSPPLFTSLRLDFASGRGGDSKLNIPYIGITCQV